MTQQEIQELAGHRQVPAWVVKLINDCFAKESERFEQEPVAWMNGWGDLFKHPDDAERGQTMRPLYTHPQPKQPLTDEQIEEIWGNTPMMLNAHNNRTRIVFARAIEAAHNIKGET